MMTKLIKKNFETYGNDFRAGNKNIDDLHKKLISDLAEQSRQEQKFEYVMKDIFSIMKNLGWTGHDIIDVNIGGVRVTGIEQNESSNPKWSPPKGTVTYQSDAFIVIKNTNRNTVVSSQSPQLPQSNQKPVKI
jgi:hypothetical protein